MVLGGIVGSATGNRAIAERDNTIAILEDVVAEKDNAIAVQNNTISQKEEMISKLEAENKQMLESFEK
ncbi:hypothetical protein [Wolbachia endosymbiont (group A) of Norellia spinipes]|uniref:hypothetical protein n=1 Tax=Wolbachia endosymbiont (group A) of Norellia spinipes TaxID=3066150 RepID=UPI0036D81BBE